VPLSTLETEQRRLETLSRYEILDSPEEPAFNDLAALATHFCDAPISLISFLDREREWFKARIGTPVREIPRACAFADRTLRGDDMVVIPDATMDDELRENPLVRDEPHIRFFAGLPLISSDGQALGALCVLDRNPHLLTPQQEKMLRILSHETTLLLELRRNVHEHSEAAPAELSRPRALHDEKSQEPEQIHEQLKRREQQLAEAERIAHLGSWDWDLKSNVVTWSDELYRIFGVQPGEFEPTYSALLKHVHPEDLPKASQRIEDALLSGGSFATEERIIRSDGTVRVVYSRGEVLRDDKGEPLRVFSTCQDVTEAKYTQQQFRNSMSLLKATIEATADGILVVDTGGHVVRYNRKFAELWHLPPEVVELYDDRRLIFLVLEQLKDPDAFVAKIDSLLAEPAASSFDVIEFKDGRVYERFSNPQWEGDNPIGRVWSFRDVTERYKVLKILRENEARYRSLVQATAQVVWIADVNGLIIEDSPSWRKFTGQTYEQLKGHGWLNAILPRDRRRVLEVWEHAVATGTVYQIDFQVRRFDGEWRFISTRGVPVRDGNGRIREWSGFCMDVTAQKNAEEAVIRERDFSRALVNSLPGIFYVLDETGLNIRSNCNLERVSGYNAQEIAKMHGTDFVPPEQRALVASRVQKVFTTGQADVELDILTKTGNRVPYYCTGKLIYLDGKPHLIGTGIDISELKRAEQEIKHLNQDLELRVAERTQQLKAINKELESFTYTASHDLRAPVRAIIGFAQAIREDSADKLDQESRMYLDRIVTSGDRMMQLIDDLLVYCRVGRQAMHLRNIPLTEFLRELVIEFEPRLKALGGTLLISDTLPAIYADPLLLRQIFSNLFENALNYRKPDVPPRIEVSARPDIDRIIICTEDNGIGIAPEHHQRIFDVFQRLNHDDRYAGTGIGLATVEKAVKTLGGEIWVESELKKGSTFCIAFKKIADQLPGEGNGSMD
jgi:PAS domain S-box-containing protein